MGYGEPLYFLTEYRQVWKTVWDISDRHLPATLNPEGNRIRLLSVNGFLRALQIGLQLKKIAAKL